MKSWFDRDRRHRIRVHWIRRLLRQDRVDEALDRLVDLVEDVVGDVALIRTDVQDIDDRLDDHRRSEWNFDDARRTPGDDDDGVDP